MIELRELILYIQEILTPIAMISGIGIISLLTQTRYGRIIDTLRSLNNEKFDLFRTKISKNMIGKELKIIDERLNNIDIQLDLLIKRSTYLKTALISFITGAFLFIFSSACILLQELVPVIVIVPIIGSSFVAGMILLIIGGIYVIVDLYASQKAVIASIEGMRELMGLS